MEGDAPNVHSSGTKAPGDINSRKESHTSKCSLRPPADAPGHSWVLWWHPGTFMNCRAALGLLPGQREVAAREKTTPESFICSDSTSVHPSRRCFAAMASRATAPGQATNHRDNSAAAFYSESEQHRAQSPNWVRSIVPGMLNTSSTRARWAPSPSRGG